MRGGNEGKGDTGALLGTRWGGSSHGRVRRALGRVLAVRTVKKRVSWLCCACQRGLRCEFVASERGQGVGKAMHPPEN